MKIRINQDVTFNWKLTVEGESVDLSKLELSVEITTPSNKKAEITPTITFDTLEFNYRPKQIGEYILSAYLNRFKDGETALDIKAFEGVKYSWNQDFSTNGNLEANYVELVGDFNFGPKLDIYKNITYTELVNLRNNAQLTSGVFYRITDYITTTTQENTRSAGHPFDVIVLTLSVNELSEQAWAIQHSGDTYFANNDLSAWKIWYCIDNDTNRFKWADSVNGKGVIYRMIDEFNNDVPYDFKNIQFKDTNSTNNYYYFTFSGYGENETDYSIFRNTNIFSNTILPFYGNDLTNSKQTINKILFSVGGDGNCYGNYFGSGCYNLTLAFYCSNNTFGNGCYSNSLYPYCSNNTFGDDCHSNTLNSRCSYNIFEYNCYSNTLGEDCRNNTFRNSCFSNSLDNMCSNNSFGNGCYSNSFRNGCNYNSFGNGCYSNSLNSNCYNNSFGERCYSNSFGNACNSNSFGNGCNSNSFDNDCYYNSFGNYCSYNSLGINCLFNSFENGCSYIKFASDSSASNKYKYYRHNHFGDGCLYIIFTGAETASSSNQVQKYNFAQGLKGTSDVYLTVNGERNRAYETYISMGTDGTIKESVIAEKQDKLIAGTGIDITDNTISCTLDTAVFTVVDALPMAPLSRNKNKIHLVLSSSSEEGNVYDEYLWTNNSWEKIGAFRPSVDLSDYAKASYVDVQINDEATARTQADTELTSKINSKQDTLTAGENIKIENNVISAISVAKISLNTTWSELKDMRDNSQLVAGQQYRITDYTCTTTTTGTKSAGHVFDIIVTADSTNVLNEEARAIQHEGDTYFADSNLYAWKIWYCIDNDTNRFNWADSVNGKGVIYRMIDEFNNDCPYDFKNIQFYRQWDSNTSLWSTIQTGNVGVPCYTFSSSGDSSTAEFTDMSLSKSSNVYSNVIKEYINIGKQTLNNICFFGHSCYLNSFGGECYFNSFGTGCDTNTFGCRCNTNSFGYGCSFNTFGNKFEHNSLGTYCLSNSFGNDCSYHSLGDTCFGNSFGNSCVYNSIGDSCDYNSFGNGCSYIKFASDSSETTKYGYYQNNHFGDGCEYIVFTGAEGVSNAREIHNYNFAQGLQGTSDNYLIVEGKRNRKYETKVAKNSKGDLKIYCEADSIQ